METKSPTHKQIVDLLRQREIVDLRGGVQLFADQYDQEYSISVNYSSTGIHIPKDQVSESDLYGDEQIKICKTWTYKEKE